MNDVKLLVPTYYGEVRANTTLAGKSEFDEPSVPVLISEAEGVRIVLGSHDRDALEKPDILVERRPSGWAIFLRPEAGGDPSGLVYFLDDGRSFLVPERWNAIQVVDGLEEVPLIDDPPPTEQPSAPEHTEPPALSSQGQCDARQTVSSFQLFSCPALKEALIQADHALAGDSGDAEYEALLALLAALDECETVACREYPADELIHDFISWSGLDREDEANVEQILDYVRRARPADSSPRAVERVLREWLGENGPDPFFVVKPSDGKVGSD